MSFPDHLLANIVNEVLQNDYIVRLLGEAETLYDIGTGKYEHMVPLQQAGDEAKTYPIKMVSGMFLRCLDEPLVLIPFVEQ